MQYTDEQQQQQYSPASQHEGAEQSPGSRSATPLEFTTYQTTDTEQDNYHNLNLIRAENGTYFRFDEVSVDDSVSVFLGFLKGYWAR